MPQVLIRIDAAGEWPVVVEDDEEVPAGDGTRWRYVCDVGSRAEGNAVRSAWLRRRLSPDVVAQLDSLVTGFSGLGPKEVVEP